MTNYYRFAKNVVCILFVISFSGCWLMPDKPTQQEGKKELVLNELNTAVWRGDYAAAKRIVDAGTSVNLPDSDGRTPLMIACGAGFPDSERDPSNLPRPTPENLEMLQLLLTHHANVNASNAQGSKALDACIFHGRTSSVEVLLKAGANVEVAVDATGGPVALAAYHCQPKIVELLLKYGASRAAKVDYKTTAREYASKQNCQDVIRLLDVNAVPHSK